ncbi:hypothetical protein ACHAXS_010965 [Conticribra weissflogii]
MQRLRGLKQLGVSQTTYVCTTHTRFEHSLGVACLAEELLRGIQEKQPKLDITEKDVICVKIAGLLHDIGHGPYSHVYDGVFRKQLEKAMENGTWLGQDFDATMYFGLPDVMAGWAHEDASLMMVDALLKYLGLEIDEKNLDKPLKQIGDGIDARCFGIQNQNDRDDDDNGENSDQIVLSCDEMSNFSRRDLPPLALDEVDILTSRDWIFIKECIVGGPLPPKGISIEKSKKSQRMASVIGRRDRFKEFLYHVVANGHSGLDVDKMDYLLRDGRRALGESGKGSMTMIMKNSYVAWGKCGNPSKCWECSRAGQDIKISTDKRDGYHLMIVYPDKEGRMIDNVMEFFANRFQKHQTIYTHSTTNAACYQICDILLLADPYLRISGVNPEDGKTPLQLPISRAMISADSYLLLNDSILDIIAFSQEPKLQPARDLLSRFHARDLYKMVAQQHIASYDGKEIDYDWQKELWDMNESQIGNEIIKCSKLGQTDRNSLTEVDVIVEKRSIHHGMKDQNPVNNVRFLSKNLLSKLRKNPDELPEAEPYPESEYTAKMPRSFLQRTVRVYCRNPDGSVQDHLETCYYQLITQLQKRFGGAKRQQPEQEVDDLPVELSQSPFKYDSDDDIDDSSRSGDDRDPKRRKGNDDTLFQRVARGSKLDF